MVQLVLGCLLYDKLLFHWMKVDIYSYLCLQKVRHIFHQLFSSLFVYVKTVKVSNWYNAWMNLLYEQTFHH